jgi:hypothetical protein
MGGVAQRFATHARVLANIIFPPSSAKQYALGCLASDICLADTIHQKQKSKSEKNFSGIPLRKKHARRLAIDVAETGASCGAAA